jgi:hypothetical protein
LPFVAIPVVIAAAAWGAGFITTAALITTVVMTGLSFAAQMLMKPASTAPAPGSVGGTPGRVTIENKQTVRSTDEPRNVIYGLARVGGVYGFIHVFDSNQTLQATLLWAGHSCASVESIKFAEETLQLDGAGVVTAGRYISVAAFEHFKGNFPQVASARLSLAPTGKWDATHRGDGITYSTMQLFWDNVSNQGDKGSKIWNGFNLDSVTAVVKGNDLIFDPRSSVTQWTSNPALCIAHYITDPVYGLGAQVDWDSVAVAANICDEVVVVNGIAEQRYTLNGYFRSSSRPDDILARMLSAMAGRFTYDGERYYIYAGAYVTPTITLTDDDMIQPSRVDPLQSARDVPNGIKGKYVDYTVAWDATDFPAVKSAAFKAADGGIERIHDVEFPFTIYRITAIRLAQIILKDARQEIVETFTGRLSCVRVLAGEFIYRTSERYGWVNKPFEVKTSRLMTTQDSAGRMVLAVEMVLKETDSTIWNDNFGVENTTDPNPDTNFPDAINPLPPGPIFGTERKYISNQGAGVRVALDLEWSASPDPFVEQYEVRYSPPGALAHTRLAGVRGLTAMIPEVTAGDWLVDVHPINWLGVVGSQYRRGIFTITGLGDVPSALEGFSVTPMGNVFALVQWQRSPDLDVTEGGTIEVRFSSMTSGATWADGRSVTSSPIPGGQTHFTIPLLTGTYMIKARDTSGVYSEMATFVQRQQSVVDFTIVGGFELIEHPDFAGTKTNVIYDPTTQFLLLVGVDDFDSIDDVDDLTTWDYPGGVITGTATAPAGSYAWSETIDLGSVKNFRLTIDMTSVVFDVFESLDDRQGDVDDWPSWDGEVEGDEADTWTEARVTLDDPSGAPTWSAWQRVETAEFSARGIQLRTFLNSTDDSYNIGISELSARFELPS